MFERFDAENRAINAQYDELIEKIERNNQMMRENHLKFREEMKKLDTENESIRIRQKEISDELDALLNSL